MSDAHRPDTAPCGAAVTVALISPLMHEDSGECERCSQEAKMNTERGEFRFTVKDREGDEQWIAFEPVGPSLKSIKGLLGFDLKAGADAKAVAQFLNTHVRALSLTQ
jgi:hypothetical protein